MTLYSKCIKALTFKNVCHRPDHAGMFSPFPPSGNEGLARLPKSNPYVGSFHRGSGTVFMTSPAQVACLQAPSHLAPWHALRCHIAFVHTHTHTQTHLLLYGGGRSYNTYKYRCTHTSAYRSDPRHSLFLRQQAVAATCTLQTRERECCLLVLNLVSSTLPCIRQPRPRLLQLVLYKPSRACRTNDMAREASMGSTRGTFACCCAAQN